MQKKQYPAINFMIVKTISKQHSAYSHSFVEVFDEKNTPVIVFFQHLVAYSSVFLLSFTIRLISKNYIHRPPIVQYNKFSQFMKECFIKTRKKRFL